MKEFVYQVNDQDRITFVDENWLRFAAENQAEFLLSPGVIGTSIWKYVGDITTIHFYQVMMAKARQTRETMTFPFRCDSPGVRRYMQLQISRLTGPALEFRSFLLREERRENMALLNIAVPRTGEVLNMCVWCKRVKTNVWREVEAAVRELKLFNSARLPFVSHITCPECESQGLSTLM